MFKKLFGLGKNKTEIYAVCDGAVIPMEEVSDPTFSQKMLGDGVAIKPSKGLVVAPADCKVTVVMEPSLHAVGLKLENGAEMLIHIGLDTVNMKGEGFKTFVKADADVKKGDALIEFDVDLVKEKGFEPDVIMIMLDGEQAKGFEYISGIPCTAGETLVGEK